MSACPDVCQLSYVMSAEALHAGITHTQRVRRVSQQFDAANKCCLQFAHTTTSYRRLFYSCATKAAIQMSQECIFIRAD